MDDLKEDSERRVMAELGGTSHATVCHVLIHICCQGYSDSSPVIWEDEQ